GRELETPADLAQRRLALAERLHHRRIELAPRLAADLGAGRLPRAAPAVGPVARHRVERVRDREDPRGEGDLLAADAVGIAVAVSFDSSALASAATVSR